MNKLTKLLSVFIIAGAIGTGVAGAVGCSNTPETDPNPEGGHTHQTWSTTGTDNEDGTHKLTCTTEGCTETKNEDHKDANNDKKCDVCDAAMGGGTTVDPNAITSITITASKTTLDAGEELTLTATCAPSTAANKAVKWSISDCDSTLTDLVSITEDGGKITVSDSSKKGGEFVVRATSVATPSVYKEETFVVNKTSRYQELAKEQNVIIAEDFNSVESLANYDLSTAGTAGVYQTINDAAGTVADYYVEIKDGKAVQVDKGGFSTITRVNFGQLESGAVRGYFEMSMSAASKITPIMFKADNGKEIFGLRNVSGFNYRLDGSGDGTAVSPATNWTGGTTYAIYFEITADKKISIEIDDVKVVDGVTISKDIAYIDFVSQATNPTAGATVVTLDNVVVIGQAKAFSEAYKTEGKGKLTAALATYTEANYRAADWTTLTTAKATGDTEIEAATSFGEVDAAVLKATTAMAAVKTDLQLTKEEQIALVDAEIAKYDETNYSADNWAAIQALVKEAKDDIEAATTKEEAQAPMTTLPGALEDVPDKNTVSYKVTFVNTDITAVNIKSGETVTKPADPTADNSEFKGWYTDATYATEFDFDNTAITAATSIYAKWVGIYNQMGTKLDGIDKTTDTSEGKTATTLTSANGLVSFKVNTAYGKEDYCVTSGEVKPSNNREFKIDLTSKSETEKFNIKIVFGIKKRADETNRAFLTKSAQSGGTEGKNGVPIGGYYLYNDSGKDYTAQTAIYTVEGGSEYFFININSNMRVTSIEVYESTKKEITDVTGTVTLGEKDAIDLSAVKFITSDSEEIAADTIPQGVTATLSEDKTKVTVSYGKISKEFTVTSAS